MARAASAPKKEISMEEALWKSADKLRGSVEPAEYKHVVLSLFFLKFASDKFEAQRKAISEKYGEKFVDNVAFYTKDNVFFLPEISRWSFIMENAKQDDIALKIDTALYTIEKANPALKGALPDNYYSRLHIDTAKLASLLDEIDKINTGDKENDIIGRVYEYFLSKFALAEGKGKGEFYTPKCIVNLIAEMIEPYDGILYDPCCGSGGMFVQSERFVEDREGRIDGQLAIYGQESNYNTWKLCKMNLAIRGIEANLGQQNADSFHNDQHKSLKADYIMANPPFNISDWGGERLIDDPRWSKYGIPPTGNANYAWILHMLYHLAPSGTAGFVLANGSLSSSTISEYNIRKNLIEDDKIDCIVTLPGGLFSTTSIPVCLWFMARNKLKNGHRDRHGEILFIDARNMETEPYEDSRTQRQLTAKTIDEITSAYHSFRNHEKKATKSDGTEIEYADKQGFWKIATLEIREKDYNLTPASYVGVVPIEEDTEPFDEKMKRLTKKLYNVIDESQKLDEEIKHQLNEMGWNQDFKEE